MGGDLETPNTRGWETSSLTRPMQQYELDVGGDQHSSISQLWDDWPNPRFRVCLPGNTPVSIMDKSPPGKRVRFADEVVAETAHAYEFPRVLVGHGGFTHTLRPVVKLPTTTAPSNPMRQDPAVSQAPTAAPRSGKPRGLRLRKRGTLTRCLQEAMKSSIKRWTAPQGAGDLLDAGRISPAHAWLRSYGFGALSKMANGDAIIGETSRVVDDLDDSGVKIGETTHVAEHVVSTVWVPFGVDENGAERKGGSGVRALLVAPELVAELVKRRMFRSVSSVLLGSMRGRALMWADEKGLSAMDLVRIMPGSITLAMLPMLDEVTAVGALRGAAGRWSVDVLGSLERGVLKAAQPLPLGNYLRRPLSWLFARQDDRVLAPGVDTLTLPA